MSGNIWTGNSPIQEIAVSIAFTHAPMKSRFLKSHIENKAGFQTWGMDALRFIFLNYQCHFLWQMVPSRPHRKISCLSQYCCVFILFYCSTTATLDSHIQVYTPKLEEYPISPSLAISLSPLHTPPVAVWFCYQQSLARQSFLLKSPHKTEKKKRFSVMHLVQSIKLCF